jgi:NADH-quinone oxidoreductase subunit G
MLSYPEAYEARLSTALVGSEDASIPEAMKAAKRQLEGHDGDARRVAIVLSARHSLEDNFALALLGSQFMGASDFYMTRRADGAADGILMVADRNSNAAGVAEVCRMFGVAAARPMGDLLTALEDGRYDYAISLGSDIDVDEGEAKRRLSALKGYVAICSHEGVLSKAAHIALPACSWAEAHGTFVNAQGRSQGADVVLRSHGDAYPGWQLAIALGRELGYDIDIKSRAELADAMLAKAAPVALPEPPVAVPANAGQPAPEDGA